MDSALVLLLLNISDGRLSLLSPSSVNVLSLSFLLFPIFRQGKKVGQILILNYIVQYFVSLKISSSPITCHNFQCFIHLSVYVPSAFSVHLSSFVSSTTRSWISHPFILFFCAILLSPPSFTGYLFNVHVLQCTLRPTKSDVVIFKLYLHAHVFSPHTHPKIVQIECSTSFPSCGCHNIKSYSAPFLSVIPAGFVKVFWMWSVRHYHFMFRTNVM